MMQHTSDVLVIGGGPAGASAALLLARAGYSVTLLERQAVPYSKPCGEYLTPGAVALLRDEYGVLPEMLAQGAVALTRETVTTHSGASFGGHTDALACPRLVTDNALRRAAQNAGVSLVRGFRVQSICWHGGAVVSVSGTNAEGEPQTWHARVTVGADGTHSLLARAMGVVRPLPRLQKLALVGHFAADGAGTSVAMHLPRDRRDACCGVGPPCGQDGTRNVNIVVPQREAAQMAGRREAYFRDTLQAAFPDVWAWVQDAQQVGPLQSIGCFGHVTTRAAAHGAALVGDAATFVHPFTGEGVFFALEGARLAAQAIGAALQANDISYSQLRTYDAARRRELAPRYKLCGLVQRVTHVPAWLEFAAQRLRRNARLTDVLLQTIGDTLRPADLLTLQTLRLAFAK